MLELYPIGPDSFSCCSPRDLDNAESQIFTSLVSFPFHPPCLQQPTMQGTPPTTEPAISAIHIFTYTLEYLGYVDELPVSAQLHGWYLNAASETPAR